METEAYKQGWNANIKDKPLLSNPYVGTDGMAWHRGWKDCQKEWDNLPLFKRQPDYK
jgi:hypothetical protein